MARVLPVPAPATTQTGPRVARTTSRCSGSSAARIASAPSASTHTSCGRRPPAGGPYPPAILAYACDTRESLPTGGEVMRPERCSYSGTTLKRQGDARVAAGHDVHDALVRLLSAAEESTRA